MPKFAGPDREAGVPEVMKRVRRSGPPNATLVLLRPALMVPSRRPSGANTTSFTTPLWPVSGSPRGRGSVGSATSHNRAVPSRVDWHEVVGMNVATYQRAIALMGTRRADAATG